MNAIPSGRSTAVLALLVALTGPLPAMAQEEAPAEESGSRLGNLYVDLGNWVAQPVGLQYTPATLDDPDAPFGSETNINIGHGTSGEGQYRLEYALPDDHGSFEYRLYKHEDSTPLSMFSPSNFIYGEALTHNLYAGAYNDRMADAFASSSGTRLREWRINYRRQAFRSPRISADWFVGWRRLEHSQSLAVEYFALAPTLPVILPPACTGPCPDLRPLSDSASADSRFEGRGLDIGIDLELPLWKNTIVLEGAAAIGVLRGDLDSYHSSSNTYYIETGSTGAFVRVLCDTPETCAEDYATFDDTFIEGGNIIYQATRIAQRDTAMTVGTSNASQNSLLVETELALRWRTPFKRLEVFGGFRQTRYDDVAVELRPTVEAGVPDSSGNIPLTTVSIDESSRSVTYEGFYGGVTFRLY